MELNDMVMVSIDDHTIEPVDMFERHMPEKYKGQGPKYVLDDAKGKGYWQFQDQETGQSGLSAVASWPIEERDLQPVDYRELRPATYDTDLRVRDMDANGILASLSFPTFAGFNGASLARSTVDQDLTNATIAAYNDWHLDEMVASHPGRFIPQCIVPLYDPEAMAIEINRVAKKGCRSISLPETPYAVGLPAFDQDGYWDPAFKAIVDNDLVLSLHVGVAFQLLRRPANVAPGTPAHDDDLVIMGPTFSTVACVDLMRGGTFMRFPDLRVAMSEGGLGWIPFILDRLDRHMTNHAWTGLKLTPEGLSPSELWRKNFLACFITDPSGLKLRDRMGIETLAWECDYPHPDSTWPRSPELLWAELQAAKCTPEEIDVITWENACRFYRWDPFAFTPREQATVGALRDRATDIDVTDTPKGEYRRRWDADHSLTGV